MNSLLDLDQLKLEAVRLETFHRWPRSASLNPRVLAKNGFYYVGPSDRVRCVFCNGILKSWRPSDDPCREHKAHFPHCPFVQNQSVGNIPIGSRNQPPQSIVSQTSVGGTESSPIVPRYSQFANNSARLKSLSELPGYVPQDRNLLANAGFFYAGHGDSVRCFSCGGTLRSWQESDDPWIEHACWFPRCPYIIEEKGEQFVKDIQSNFVSNLPNRQPIQSPQRESPVPFQRRRSSSGISRNSSSRRVPAFVQAVIDMGYQENLVQQVLQKELQKGNPITHAESLMLAVEEHMTQSPGSNSPTHTISSLANKIAATNLEEPSERFTDRIMCKICMDKEVEVTFLPCGHLVCCEPCSRLVKECPVCRNNIRGTVRTYLA